MFELPNWMTDPLPNCEEAGGLMRGETRMAHYALLGAVCALVIGAYVWSAKSLFWEFQSLGEDMTYYNLLVEGFRAGQLNLKCEVPSELAALTGRSDSKAGSAYRVEHHPLTDVSYYRGKLYLYFGVTPAVLLFWPYRELAGHNLFHKEAVVIFLCVGYLASVGLLWAVWRRCFAAVEFGVVAACALAVGLANFTLLCLPRGGVYDVAISCGYALTMVTLILLWQAIHAVQRRVWWLAGASLAYGLAVGARPSLLFGAIILLVPVAILWRERAARGQRPQLWTLFLAATGPILCIGLGLMLYNYLRFDSPFEFGEHYVLSWTGQHFIQLQSGIQLFSPRFLWCDLQAYFLAPARWSGRFPFVHDITSSPLPLGHVGIEHAFGVLSNLPLVWLGLAVPLSWRGRLGGACGGLRWFGLTLALLFGMCALTICLFFTAYSRYQLEYLPALVWLTVLGILGLERTLAGRPVWRRASRWGWGLLLAFSVAFNLFAMFELGSDLYVSSGVISIREGHLDEAVAYFRKALKLQPDNAGAHSNFGTALFRQGKVPEAIAHLEEALRLQPDYAEAHNSLGFVLFQEGKVAEAIGHYQVALRLKPDDPEAHNNLAGALFHEGKASEAIGHWEQALRLKLDYADAHFNLGTAWFQLGQATQAVERLEEALRLEPDDVTKHFNYGICLDQLGRVPEAIREYERALQLKPDLADAYCNLGKALLRQGKDPEAIGHLAQAVRIKPDFAEAQNHLAWVLATCVDGSVRNGPRAVELAEGANKLAGGKEAAILDTLAAAYAEAGRLAEAVRTAERAVQLAKGAGQAEQARQIQERLQLYQAGRPYHERSASSP